MSTPTVTPQEAPALSDAGNWARPVDTLTVGALPAGALNLNVAGKQLTGPIRGFGQMWQKTYRVRLAGQAVTPQAVISTWKANFASFWPKGNALYVPAAGLVPGETAIINAVGPGNIRLMATGVTVIYADDESFAYMTPAGHPFNGMITFSAYDDEGTTVVQVQLLVRPYDPLYELGFRLRILSASEDMVWRGTLTRLARHFGVEPAAIDQKVVLVDPRIQWSEARNVWDNAIIRSMLYVVAGPFRWLRNLFGGRQHA